MPTGQPPLFPDAVDPTSETTFAPRKPRSSPEKGSERPSRSWRQRLLVGSGLFLVLGLLAVVAMVGYGWWRWSQVGTTDLDLAAASEGPQNYLIVGSDTREVVSEGDADADAFLNGPEEYAGQRSDTIMLVRVDPSAKTIDMMSFPRDLWLEVAGTGANERINTAYGLEGGPQRLVDTIKLNYGIDVNHYIEVDFRSFKGVVDAVGGVPVYFQDPMRDTSSGLVVDAAGCVTLDGEQALAFSRARHLEYLNANGVWVTDPTGDLGRISRQQEFIRKMIDQAAASTKGFDVKAINSIVASTADNVTIDSGLDFSQVMDLAGNFKSFTGDQIISHTLPVQQDMTAGGAAVLELDAVAAEPVLNVFRGLPPEAVTATPSQVSLTIRNGSGRAGQAGEASKALTSAGFTVEGTGDAPTNATKTVVRYAPGSAVDANLVLAHLSAGGTLQSDSTLKSGEIVLVTGSDFTTVSAAALDVPPVADDSSATSSTTTTADPDVISEPVGVVPEDPADGTACAA